MTTILETTQVPGGRPAFTALPEAFGESLILDGAKIDPNITEAITAGGAILTRTMDGAESLELTVSDPDMRLLRSGALTKAGKPSSRQKQLKEAAWDRFATMRLSMDGVFFRLAGVSLAYDEPPWSVTLTFESEVAMLMRLQTRPVKTSRGGSGKGNTRVGFIHKLASLAMDTRLLDRMILPFSVFSPDPDVKSPIAKPKDADRNKGLSPSAHLTVKGQPITSEQRRLLTIALQEAEDQNATERVFLAMLVAAIGESSVSTVINSLGYGGVFQGQVNTGGRYFKATDTKQEAHYFLAGGKGFNQGGAIKLAAANPDMSPGTIATKVETSGESGGFYDAHRKEADAILAAWGGSSKTITTRESYEYKAGAKDTSGRRENYWDASGRLVDEVRWRRFATRNALWVGPDEWFFRNRPTFVVDGSRNLADQGVLGFRGDVDIGMPVSELTLRVIAPRWTSGPGTVFEFTNLGPLGHPTGRWLIWENRLDLTRALPVADITLRRPAPTKAEPAPGTRTASASTPEGTATVEGLQAICRRFSGSYLYGGGHGPRLATLKYSDRLDCSSSTSLALLKAGMWDSQSTARVSGAFNTWGAAGQGDDVTVWYSGEHVFIQGKGWRFDTNGPGGGNGPRFRTETAPTSGYRARHWEAPA